MKDHIQPSILHDVPAHNRYQNISIQADGDLQPTLKAPATFANAETMVIDIGESFDACQAILARMTSKGDPQIDAPFSFTTPITDSCFCCPPRLHGSQNLERLGCS